MDNEVRSILRSLELQNEAKAQDVSNAYQTIATLEDQVSKLEGEIVNLNQQLGELETPDTTYVASEPQTAFLQKVADSKSKFAKEAEDILASLNNTPVVTPEVVADPVTPAPEEVVSNPDA